MPLARGITGLGSSTNSSQLILAIGGPFVAAQMCIIGIAFVDPTITVSSISDDTNGPDMVFTKLATTTLSNGKFELWATGPSGTNGGGSFVSINMSGPVYAAATMECWSGVGSIVQMGSITGATPNPSISDVTLAGNNMVVASFLTVGSTIPTALVGTISRSIFSGP